MIRSKTLLIAAAAFLAVGCSETVLAQTAEDAVGEWHGTLATPQGETTLVLYVTQDESGTLKGQVENAYQAPGNMAHIDTISVEDGHLSWKIDRIGATFEGDWNAAEQEWKGEFQQGVKAPFTFEKGLPPPFPVVEGMDGVWQGVAELNGAKLRQVVAIRTGERGTMVIYASPDQLVNGLPIRDLAIDGANVTFSAMNGLSTFKGTLSEDRNQLTGEFTTPLNDNVAAVTLTRGEFGAGPRPGRPQNPVEPFPYKVEEVGFDNLQAPGVRLAGTLTLPEGEGPFPAAIMITGSGGQDRDESLMGHRPFAVIADYLTRNGIAVLRYDDRGIGASKSPTPYDDATSADLATDANAAFALLRRDARIDPLAIGFVGHSEGGMIAPIAMADNPYAAYAVLLAGPGTGLDRLMVSQQRLVLTSMGASEQQIADREPVMAAMFKAIGTAPTLEAGKAAAKRVLTPAALTALGVPADFDKDFIVNQFSSPWFRYFFRYDPVPNLARIRAPLLALNGSLDLQVPADDNLGAIRAATKDHPDVTLVKLDGLNHLFQHATTGGIGEYATIEETFSPEALELMAKWINQRFGAD
jgi:pimeloyl-ACP methyl ester carboxylesterase